MKLQKIDTEIEGCYIIKLHTFEDDRGGFTKLFHDETFRSLGLHTEFREEYYSTSKKGVLRGLHFQLPPHEHTKCITCVRGSIWDVVVDLRKDSKTFQQHAAFEISATEPTLLYIPKGLAHGFYTLQQDSIFLNKTSTVFNPECDTGIKWDSCGINWPDKHPILSEKDKGLVGLEEFDSPF